MWNNGNKTKGKSKPGGKGDDSGKPDKKSDNKNYDRCSPGENDISSDPVFADPLSNNYHLNPSSPCIDTGQPEISDMDGTRSDMGAYGGKWHDEYPPAWSVPEEKYDINGDGQIDENDVDLVIEEWKKCKKNHECNSLYDFDGDGEVGFSDILEIKKRVGKEPS